MTMRRLRTILLLALICAFPYAHAKHAPHPAYLQPTDTLPMDSAVVRGTLPNGLSYYIYFCGRPANKVSL